MAAVDKVELLEHAVKLAQTAGEIHMRQFRDQNLSTRNKLNDSDIVTAVDIASEKAIIEGIRSIYPDHTILSEESGLALTDSEYEWVIDPLDGTTNYRAGLPVFSVSIGVKHRGETVVGVVFAPYLREMFVAAKGWGAFLNGNPIRVTRNEVLSRAVVGTGFPVDKMNTTDNNIDNFSRVLPVVRDVRRLGSAAMDICYVAAGVLDAFWELNLHEWDVCAALLIASEAGAEYEYFRSDRNVSVLVGSSAIKNAIRPLLSSQPG